MRAKLNTSQEFPAKDTNIYSLCALSRSLCRLKKEFFFDRLLSRLNWKKKRNPCLVRSSCSCLFPPNGPPTTGWRWKGGTCTKLRSLLFWGKSHKQVVDTFWSGSPVGRSSSSCCCCEVNDQKPDEDIFNPSSAKKWTKIKLKKKPFFLFTFIAAARRVIDTLGLANDTRYNSGLRSLK